MKKKKLKLNMLKLVYINILFFFLLFSCKETDVVGLEVQPTSDRIEIFSDSFSQQDSLFNFIISTESVDSLRSDETSLLLLGGLVDPVFGLSSSSFTSQISLSESNIDLGENPIVDSVIYSYSYSGYYGDITSFNEMAIHYCGDDEYKIYKDSIYYSDYNNTNCYDVISAGILQSFTITSESSTSPVLKMALYNNIGQQILDMGTNGLLVNNETFQDNFGHFIVQPRTAFSHSMSLNTILYLNPSGVNSEFTIYYHNNSSNSLELNFILDGESARINSFTRDPFLTLINSTESSYVQSMAGYKTKIELQNRDNIKDRLYGKAINQVILSFDVEDNTTYPAHDNISLVRVDSAGDNIFLSDYVEEGAAHFGGNLVDNSYEFNITRYFNNYLNDDDFTNNLYLLASGAVINANRTIIDNNAIKITVLYSEL